MRLQGSVVRIGRGLKAMDCYPMPIGKSHYSGPRTQPGAGAIALPDPDGPPAASLPSSASRASAREVAGRRRWERHPGGVDSIRQLRESGYGAPNGRNFPGVPGQGCAISAAKPLDFGRIAQNLNENKGLKRHFLGKLPKTRWRVCPLDLAPPAPLPIFRKEDQDTRVR
jgi:hypothetical protein